MKNIYLLTFLFFAFSAFPQEANLKRQYEQIPVAYQSHPELGKITRNSPYNEVDYELVHERTKFSRTFLNTNKTKTTVQSSVPLHYQSSDGLWHSVDYRLSRTNNKIVYPAQDPYFEVDAKKTSIAVGAQKINFRSQGQMIFVSDALENSKKFSSAGKEPTINKEQIVFKNVAPDLDKRMSVFNQALKLDYVIKSAAFFPGQLDYMLLEEVVELPSGFVLEEELASGKITNRLIIRNPQGQEVLTFQQPVISDSKVITERLRQLHQPYETSYQLIKVNETTYKIQIRIDGSWLKSGDRVFPIIIDPVVTVTNNDIVTSCFFPAYQQATLQVAVPAGQTVLASDISYDFVAVAGSGAWMADQRSFVAGPNGQTPVVAGVGGTEGMYTYNLANSSIGNVVSTGQLNFTFNFSRNWGGSGCNATYNFVNRREVAVTYGTIDFGTGPVVINEYSASNRNFNDGFGRPEDWIELYNASPNTYFNLAGYHLSNDIDNPTKWQITSGVIPPNSRVLIFCSDRDISSGTVLHSNFDLTQLRPDQVVLADPAGTILESHEMYVTQTNHSYGRTSDGASTWSVFTSPTPGTVNQNGFTAYASKPVFSVPAGRYSGSVSVALSSTGTNEQIRYTTNGSTPTATSTLYTGPISINASTVLRARTFSTLSTVLPSFIETNTYFINETTSLPVISLSGDANLQQLFNGTQNEPIAYMEYFEGDGTFIEENMGDFNKHGNDSWAYGQRGVDFISRDDHGYKRRLDHNFFATTDRTKFRRLIFKAAASDNYPFETGGAHMRDVFAHTLSQLSGLELDERSASYVSLFVNGQYWGIYDMREKVDDNQYTDHYYGQDYKFRDSDEYLQFIKTWGSTYPEFGNQPAMNAWNSLTAFVQDNDMAVEANYNYVNSQLDINSLVDYFVFNSYLVNRDWLNWNTSWWRGTNPEGGAQKWRYTLWDMDGILGHYVNFTGISNPTATAAPCQAENINVGVGHAQTIGKLIEESPIVRQQYITRYADLLNTKLSCEKVTQVFDSIVAVITPEMPRQIQRWGGNLTTWQSNVQAARNFLLQRCSQTVSSGMANCYNVTGPFATVFQVEPASSGKIKMNSEWLTTYPYTAQVFGNIETLLKAEANPGFEFSHWEVDGAVIQPNANDPDIVLQISQATSVTAHFNDLINNGDDVIYYWHFNTLQTPTDVVTILADYKQIPTADPMMTYTGSGPRDIDASTSGSLINLHQDQGTGSSARVRNPSDGRSLVFDLPTTGYKDIKFAYAVERTAQGQLTNNISYSVDGVNYIQTGLAQTAFTVGTTFGFVQVDFTSIDAVNNNPNFKVKIEFDGNTSGDSGNNRFDNITMKGVEFTLTTPSQAVKTHQVFPNPFTNNVQIISSEQISELMIFDMLGKNIWQKPGINSNSYTVDLGALKVGVYLLKIRTANGVITHKLIKQ